MTNFPKRWTYKDWETECPECGYSMTHDEYMRDGEEEETECPQCETTLLVQCHWLVSFHTTQIIGEDKCEDCGGTGHREEEKTPCIWCDGKGKRPLLDGNEVECTSCKGTGDRPPRDCWKCNGKGHIRITAEGATAEKVEKWRNDRDG